MGNIIKPSTAMLPMRDIANVLTKDKEFMKVVEHASDTDAVGGVSSELIAMAAEAGDRETVKNALELGGIEASQYITSEEATDLRDTTMDSYKISIEEFRNLRDELYQLKSQLTKQGLINETNPYQGFQDYFRNENIKFMDESLGGIESSARGTNIRYMYPTRHDEFSVGDVFVIKKTEDPDNNNFESFSIHTVTAKDSARITFTPATSELIEDYVELYKSLGQYNAGAFTFSKVDKNVTTDKERYTMLNDDTNTQGLLIDKAKSGYAVSFKVPDDTKGVIKEFTIKGMAHGNPGSLISYIIPKEDIKRHRNLAESTSAGRVIGLSSPIEVSKAKGSMTKLSFKYKDPITNKAPLLENKEYCFIIEATKADTLGNHWEILFSYNKDASGKPSNLQTNNKSYYYLEVAEKDTNPENVALVTNSEIEKYDMYFILVNYEVAPVYEKAYDKGLYTSNIKLPTSIQIARARLMLRINREGNFISESTETAYDKDSDSYSFSVVTDPNWGDYNFSAKTGMRADEMVAIDGEVRKLNGVHDSMLYIKDNALIKKASKVYRVGYKVYLKATFKYLDKETEEKTVRTQVIELPLKAVIEDGHKKEAFVSDRLLFEGEFDMEDDSYIDELQLQVMWDSNTPTSIINNFRDLTGKIYDLSLSLDKSL